MALSQKQIDTIISCRAKRSSVKDGFENFRRPMNTDKLLEFVEEKQNSGYNCDRCNVILSPEGPRCYSVSIYPYAFGIVDDNEDNWLALCSRCSVILLREQDKAKKLYKITGKLPKLESIEVAIKRNKKVVIHEMP